MLSEPFQGLLIYRFANLGSLPGMTHWVMSRLGGDSDGVYRGLNISFGTGDDPSIVRANRLAMYQAIGAPPSRVVVARQVHSDRVLAIHGSSGEAHQDGWRTMDQEGDGMVTAEPGLFLQMVFGDCTPLLLYDPAHRVVGIAHAGWKGTIACIGARTVEAMQKHFGSRPADIYVGIGPSIGPCCYQVREDVATPARQTFGANRDIIKPQPDGAYYFDLWEANRQALLVAGVPLAHIETASICTRCNSNLFFSNRAGDKGRFAALVALTPLTEEK